MIVSAVAEPLTIGWISGLLMLGFVAILLPKLDRGLALLGAIASGLYAWPLLATPEPIAITLLDRFGVSLVADSLGAYFILTNAIVTAAVVLYYIAESSACRYY